LQDQSLPGSSLKVAVVEKGHPCGMRKSRDQ
jgi:hypothetical protein